MDFLRRLKEHTGRKKAVLLLDNLGVHRTNAVKNLAAKFDIELVFNGTYSSNFMPIERLWAWAKHQFTRQCAKDAPYHDQRAMERLVERCIYLDFSSSLSKRIKTCLDDMRNWLK